MLEENLNLRRSEKIQERSNQRSISDDESTCDDTAEIKESQMFAPDVPESNAEIQTEINRKLFRSKLSETNSEGLKNLWSKYKVY